MNPVASLFQQRSKQAWIKGARYTSLIAKGLHFLPIAVLLLIYFGYRALLTGLPPEFPIHLLLAILLTWIFPHRNPHLCESGGTWFSRCQQRRTPWSILEEPVV